MNGLDTNILTRYFTQDDPIQSAKARHLVEQALIETQPLFINHVVLCELVWVLVRSYRYSKADICAILEKILLAKQFWVENEPLVCNALADFKTSSADFADCLIGVKNLYAGCHSTLTFDRAAAGLSSFNSLD